MKNKWWLSEMGIPVWHFWSPLSGLVGGVILGFVLSSVLYAFAKLIGMPGLPI